MSAVFVCFLSRKVIEERIRQMLADFHRATAIQFVGHASDLLNGSQCDDIVQMSLIQALLNLAEKEESKNE